MNRPTLRGFKVKNYKCFLSGNDYQGFDEIKPINVIIGKNNSGKSKILEYLQLFLIRNHDKKFPDINEQILLKKSLTKEDLEGIFRSGTREGHYGHLADNYYHDWWSGVGTKLLNKIVTVTNQTIEINENPFTIDNQNKVRAFEMAQNEIKSKLVNPLYKYEFLSIKAERDLKKESLNHSNGISVNADGSAVTSLIVQCIYQEKGFTEGNKALVEKELLQQINAVLAPDLFFTRIYALADDQGNSWEIFLEEEHKGGVKLSDCGSGIKTIIFVMVVLYVLPKIKKHTKFIYALEELENNLHPSLERKLLAHVRDYIISNPDSLLFLTTHSSVAIDMFSNNSNAQILKAHNDGKGSFIERADNWKAHNNLLDDLGVKASDVLQSNCVVWLEGPSDRIYFKKWIEIFNDGEKLEENLHYQCVFYGGTVLANYSASDDPDIEDFVKMLRINRNAIIIMDSDKSTSSDSLKDRVNRILQEAATAQRIKAWVTDGREIENYLTKELLSDYFEQQINFQKFEYIANKYKSVKTVETFDKVKFAAEITSMDSYNLEALQNHLDLKDKMLHMIEYIRKCNN